MMVIAVAVIAIVVLVIVFKAVWRVAGPNEALIISGLGAGTESPGFKVATGRGTVVLPGVQTCHRLSLDTRSAALETTCVTSEGTSVRVHGVMDYKVGDDRSSIAAAARRFLDQEELMDDHARMVIESHLRSVIGALTFDDLFRDRARPADEARSSSTGEMGKLGLVAVSLRLRDIDDLGKVEKSEPLS